jgi:hypothetical protein
MLRKHSERWQRLIRDGVDKMFAWAAASAAAAAASVVFEKV